MTHRCTVQRNTSYGGGSDSWNQDAPAVWTNLATEVPCYYWYDEQSPGLVRDGDKVVPVTRRRMIVPLGQDITEHDRVLSVTDVLGNELADGPMAITHVGNRKDHRVVRLEDF
jgi:hypothetical protein